MRIGIVGSGIEMMPLLQILQELDISYEFMCDWKYWPWAEKSVDLRKERVIACSRYLVEDIGVDWIVVPPCVEQGCLPRELQEKVLPLFSTYLLKYVLPYSLVGKLGVLCDEVDMIGAEQYIHTLTKQYTLTPTQQKIKKFHHTFPVRKKNVRMRTYFLTTYGKRDRMMRKTIKYDLAYFLDADVDTLIPLSWGHVFYEIVINKRTNWKKIRFHGKKAVCAAFDSLVDSSGTTEYSMRMHYTDYPAVLLHEKKWMDVLTRGGSVEVSLVHAKI